MNNLFHILLYFYITAYRISNSRDKCHQLLLEASVYLVWLNNKTCVWCRRKCVGLTLIKTVLLSVHYLQRHSLSHTYYTALCGMCQVTNRCAILQITVCLVTIKSTHVKRIGVLFFKHRLAISEDVQSTRLRQHSLTAGSRTCPLSTSMHHWTAKLSMF